MSAQTTAGTRNKGQKAQAGNGLEAKVGSAAKAAASGLIQMEEAIRLLKTTRPTFYRWLRAGRIKGMKVGRQWRFYREDIERFLTGQTPRVDLPVDIRPLSDTLRQRLAALGAKDPEVPGTPLEQAVRLMILLAFRMRASDIHIASHQTASNSTVTSIRLRVDGVLHGVAEIDRRLLPAVIEEWKRLAACDVHEKARPQDGRIEFRVAGPPERSLDVRVNFLPAALGPSLTARILDQVAVQLTLDRLPYGPQDQDRIQRALRLPWGIILCTGPTGSGKTTTLYACLNKVATPETKALSVEDPVEYLLPWVTQVPVRVDAGLTFAAAVRSMLRADPDVILIGEVRDRDTLVAAVQAALTGHLVLSTLHTEDAATALRRAVDIGVDPFLVGDAVKLVIAQRLVRKLCTACSVEDHPAEAVLQEAEQTARAGGVDWSPLPHTYKRPVGCPACGGTGYRGRTTIVETLEVTPDVVRALREGKPVEELRAAAIRGGMTPMLADGARRFAAGEVTWAEVMRVVRL